MTDLHIAAAITNPLPVAGANPAAIAGQDGTAAGGGAFAALIAGLLTEDAIPADAGGMSVAALLANLVSAEVPEESDVPEDQRVSLEAVLEGLLALLESLPPEAQMKLSSASEVAEWMALADAEITMSGWLQDARPAMAADPFLADESRQEGQPMRPVSDVLEKLLQVLRSGGQDVPYVTAVAEQGKTVLTKAIESYAALQANGTSQASAGVQSASDMQASATPRSAQSQAAADISGWLTKTNGRVAASEQKTDHAGSGSRMSHLTAMQAKSLLIRPVFSDSAMPVHSLELIGKGNGADSVQAVKEEPAGWMNASLESLKTSAAEAGVKPAETAAQRMPLANASEQLNAWILKQAGSGGNLRTETVIRLVPEHLGQVEVKLSMQNGQLSATIMTDSVMAKDALESNLASLRLSLHNQGVTVERLVVAQTPQSQSGGFSSGMFHDGRGQRQFSEREQDRGQRFANEESAEDWLDVLAISAEQGTAIMEGYGSGSSFRAEA